MSETLYDLYTSFFGASVVVAPEYLLLSLPIAWVLFRLMKPGGRFWRWLLPREVYFHRSHLLDLKLFAIGRLMVFSGLLGRISLATAVAAGIAGLFAGGAGPAADWSPWMLALMLWLVADAASYWVHRLHHHWRVLWPLHAVHHSAEVLTPFTAYRQHPLALVTSGMMNSLFAGIGQGLLLGALDPSVMIHQIAGVNAFIVLANAAMANFHHSHIWVSFGPIVERLIISPAQHQVHHSTAPEHFDKNFGQTLALWDWLFGSLYIVRGTRQPGFGLDRATDPTLAGNADTPQTGTADDPRPQRLGETLIEPLRSMLGRR